MSGAREKAAMWVAIWRRYLRVRSMLHRESLRDVVVALSTPADPWSRRDAMGMSRAVNRALLGPTGPIRCLPRALVLYSLLCEHGARPSLVVGVLPTSDSHEAHAWVEVDGADVGPKPGRNGRSELIRYP